MSDLDAAAQPSCPTCLTVMQPNAGGDECRECGWRVEWPEAEHPGMGGDIPDIRT